MIRIIKSQEVHCHDHVKHSALSGHGPVVGQLEYDVFLLIAGRWENQTYMVIFFFLTYVTDLVKN